MEFFIKIASLMADACSNPEKLPVALLACGIVEAAAALCLLFFKPAAGIFANHGDAPFYLYYGILVAMLMFGFLEASAGIWVSGDPTGRSPTGKTILCLSILPLVVVAALGGFVVLLKLK